MKLQKRKSGETTLGIRISMIALLLICIAWIMQFYSVMNWDNAVKLGLQNGSFKGDPIAQLLVRKEWGEAIADLFWPLPLTIIALVGIMRRTVIGVSHFLVTRLCNLQPSAIFT